MRQDSCSVQQPCTAGGASADVNRSYHWPHGRGPPQHYGQSPYSTAYAVKPPCSFEAALKWTWQHPEGRYHTLIMGGPVIDDERNVYLAIVQGIRKFGPDGELLWSWDLIPSEPEAYPMNTPALMDGRIYCCSTDGIVHAIDMQSGVLVWSSKVADTIGGDNGFIVARDGRVLLDAGHSVPSSGVNNYLVCLNGTDGKVLWKFLPDVGVWNFLPLLPMHDGESDGTVVFQSWSGSVYRVDLASGNLMGRAGPLPNETTFTDGGAALGANGLLYAVTSLGVQIPQTSTRGGLHAFRISDMQLVWERTNFTAGIYTYPVVAALHAGAHLSVVTGVGSLPGFPYMSCMAEGGKILFRSGAGFGLIIAMAMQAHKHYWGKARRLPRFLCSLGAWCICTGIVASIPINFLIVYSLVPNAFPYSVQAFHADTGRLEWRVELPTWKWPSAAGDEAGVLTRNHLFPWRPLALPCGSSYPTVDARGVVYFAHMDGNIYGIKDWNRDGVIDKAPEAGEFCSFHAGATGFTAGPSIAPGMLAVSTSDTLLVFGE